MKRLIPALLALVMLMGSASAERPVVTALASEINPDNLVSVAFDAKINACDDGVFNITILVPERYDPEEIDQLIATGQKLQARSAAENAVPYFAEVNEAQKLLVAVDADATEETLMLPETRQLQQRLMAMVAQLKNALTICLRADAKIFNSAYPALQAELQGHLSKIGCNFVTDPNTADWVIDILAQAREYNTMTMGNVSTYFVYVDANIAITKTATGQRVYENMFSEKGGHTHNYEQAARDAYKYLLPKLREVLDEQIVK